MLNAACVCAVDQETDEVFVEEVMIQAHTYQMTGWRGGNPYYAAELGLTAGPADENTSAPAAGIPVSDSLLIIIIVSK